jgi:hypothetical protein
LSFGGLSYSKNEELTILTFKKHTYINQLRYHYHWDKLHPEERDLASIVLANPFINHLLDNRVIVWQQEILPRQKAKLQ